MTPKYPSMNLIKFLRKKLNIRHRNRRAREKWLSMMPIDAVCGEIGVWKGNFSNFVLTFSNPKSFHLIDPWKYQTEFGDRLFGGSIAQEQKDMDDIFEQVKRRFADRSNVHFHRKFSDEAVLDFSDEYFDWVYVDGNHYYEFVLNDLNNYFAKVKKGGFLTGDDFNWTSKELNGDRPVKRAVKDFIESKKNEITLFKRFGSQYLIKKA